LIKSTGLEISIDEPPSQLLLATILTPDFWYFIFTGAIFLFLMLSSAIVSGSEVAYFSLSPSQIADCKNSDMAREQNLAKLLDKPKNLLATILILNNFVNISMVTLSTFMMWRMLGTTSDEGLAALVLAFIVTLLIVFVGEVIPKVYATQNNVRVARFSSSGLMFFQNVFKPLSFLLLSMSNVIDKRVVKKGYELSVDELNHAVELTTSNEETTSEERDILKGIVNFGTFTVKQVMRSRMDVTAFEANITFHELMDKINKTGFSRIPIFTETIDKIDGVLYSKDMLPYIEKEEDFQWKDLLRPVYFVPETKKIDGLLKDFQEKRVHMAIVVDEYGGTSGLITLEDIIEEIVGEINDEFDEDDKLYTTLDKNTYVFEGKTSLNDFCKVVDADPSIFEEVKGESESLGGLLLEINSVIPTIGEKIEYDKYAFTVVAVDKKRIKKIKIQVNE
jgi:gliding motility-associated protein GldE